MKLRDVWNFPGNLVSGLTDLVLGREGSRMGQFAQEGVVGNLTALVRGFAQLLSSFVNSHRHVINAAFWFSLAFAAGAGLTGALLANYFPAAFSAVINFTVYGYSIAGLAGEVLSSQLAVAAGLAAAGTTALTVGVSVVEDVRSGLYATYKWCTARKPVEKKSIDADPSVDSFSLNTSSTAMSQLGGTVEDNTNSSNMENSNNNNSNNNNNNNSQPDETTENNNSYVATI